MDQQRIIQRLNELKPEKNYTWDDTGVAKLLSDVLKEECRYNATARNYYFYKNGVWSKDVSEMVMRRNTKIFMRSLVQYSSTIESEELSRKCVDQANKWNSSRKRDLIIKDARDCNFFCTEDLDTDDYILNLQNGVLKFTSTGVEFTEHSPDFLLSKICNVAYDQKAKAERWISFLDEVLEGDREKIRYLQKLFGLCLTGNIELERMWFLYGPSTRNGKSTLLETIAYLLGGYAVSINAETLASKTNVDSRRASPDIAKTHAARLVVAPEPKKGMLLDVGLLKSITGRDVISARFLNEQEFSFVPKYKLICNCNYLPTVNDNTLFKSERTHVISFNRHFTEEEQDLTLKSRFREPESMSGILNWMVQGWILYKEEGLKASTVVRADTLEYEQNSDKMRSFITERLKEKPGNYISVKELYSVYTEWCHEVGHFSESKSNFIAELKARDMFKPRATINGKQVRNVVSGYAFQESEDDFVDINYVPPWAEDID